MVRGFNVNMNQVNGSGDNLSEQPRPLLQVEDVRIATGVESALLESRDQGYFVVDMPNFWERRETSGLLRDVNDEPDKYDWIKHGSRTLPAPRLQEDDDDADILTILRELRS
ncbi:hypothetical protein BHK69_02610 [Bosea vaviloviae]|uniref:Uncharacterized protein n=2 Tax=Bosea vaviloviae TaxID=1526658 RepID=A0A1D7TWM7_9HYPH|nr:hypothetical protein BHK69_02610 [Bosea vaviloviae]